MNPLLDLLKKIEAGGRVCGLGLMSGTSADGTDVALLEFSKKRRPKLLAAKTFAYPLSVRKKILEFQQSLRISPQEAILFSQFLGEVWVGLVKKFSAAARTGRPDFIASHGQTLRHVSELQVYLGQWLRGSWQAGEADVLAKRLKTIVVSDFRAGDIALGGSGAPLMPYVHQYLFASPRKVRAILNLGGIANLTFLGKKSFWAADTGPGNCLADYLAQKFYRLARDPGGKKAMQGTVSSELLSALKKNPFFARPFPKSTGKEDFSVEWLEGILKGFRKMIKEDILATAETLTAWGAAQALRKNAKETLEEVYLAGGGTRNIFFQKQLQNFLPGVSLHVADQLGWPAGYLEAAGFAIFGWWCLLGETKGSAMVTGAKKKGVLGKLSQP